MARIVWDQTGERLYETGVEKGVLYPQSNNGLYPFGVPWNGLTAVNESPSGAEAKPIYADNIQYLNIISVEKYAATVEAYMYPDEFAECDGSVELSPGVYAGQQTRRPFGMCYRTAIGNDTENVAYGYKLHMIYGATAKPSSKDYGTINEDPEAITLSWELDTIPVNVTGKKPTASLVVDSTKVDPAKLAILENILYGSEGVDPRLPLPDEVAAILGGELPSAVALSSIVPADEATGVLASSNVVLTFNNKIQSEAILVTSELGVIVAGTKTWDAAHKVLTFTPAAAFESGTTYLVAVAGVADVHGQSLAPVVKNFTVA